MSLKHHMKKAAFGKEDILAFFDYLHKKIGVLIAIGIFGAMASLIFAFENFALRLIGICALVLFMLLSILLFFHIIMDYYSGDNKSPYVLLFGILIFLPIVGSIAYIQDFNRAAMQLIVYAFAGVIFIISIHFTANLLNYLIDNLAKNNQKKAYFFVFIMFLLYSLSVLIFGKGHLFNSVSVKFPFAFLLFIGLLGYSIEFLIAMIKHTGRNEYVIHHN
ncbi:MAG: hypothetical protein KKF44_04610 [Nanoarchaeota archaeon]|nr:hypothetical protein [Nanoarchaeota archaeon]